ncbi:MAG: hypothetical protein WC713_00925 [Candidatus Methylomirabilota bacterium]
MGFHQRYNPHIIGFAEGHGYLSIPLETAREEYGELPSDYGLVPHAPGRRARKALNLPLGLALLKLLRERPNLAEPLSRFAERWGRDFQADFSLTMDPFFRFNDPTRLKRILDEAAGPVLELLRADVRERLRRERLIPPATLSSIPPESLLSTARTILGKRLRNPAHAAERARFAAGLTFVEARQILDELCTVTGGDVCRFGLARLAVHADEIARGLWRLSRLLPLDGVDRLHCVRGQGVEFAYAPRDAAFIALGREVGDCTADKAVRQVDRDVESIYWTVFAWFLDRHYQILKVHVDGRFVMKVHLVPLFAAGREGGVVFLGVDAIETTPGFREDTRQGRSELLSGKAAIFARVVDEVRRIAEAAGIAHVFAERFSNTAWVREELLQFPEVYLQVEEIRKIDELEDVFALAARMAALAGQEAVRSVFMELQMKNTLLQRGGTSVRGAKAFACIAGDPRVGLSLKRVSGI